MSTNSIYYPKPSDKNLVCRTSRVSKRPCDGNAGPDGPTKKIECSRVTGLIFRGERYLQITYVKPGGTSRHCPECALTHFRVRHLTDPKA